MSDQAAWDVGERAASVLAPETDLFAEVDMVGFGQALAGAARGAGPAATAGAALRLAGGFAQLPWVAVSRWLGGGAEPPVQPDAKDRRFRDPAWSENPLFYATRQSYLLMRRFVGEVLDGQLVFAILRRLELSQRVIVHLLELIRRRLILRFCDGNDRSDQ